MGRINPDVFGWIPNVHQVPQRRRVSDFVRIWVGIWRSQTFHRFLHLPPTFLIFLLLVRIWKQPCWVSISSEWVGFWKPNKLKAELNAWWGSPRQHRWHLFLQLKPLFNEQAALRKGQSPLMEIGIKRNFKILPFHMTSFWKTTVHFKKSLMSSIVTLCIVHAANHPKETHSFSLQPRNCYPLLAHVIQVRHQRCKKILQSGLAVWGRDHGEEKVTAQWWPRLQSWDQWCCL